MATPELTSKIRILSGWKQIASHLKMGVRTAQRYEREASLPIRRRSRNHSAVFALEDELDAWSSAGHRGKQGRLGSRAAFRRFNEVGVNFLIIDSEVALTFTNLAMQAKNPEKKRRTTEVALKAYETITRLRRELELGKPEEDKLEANLARLRRELQSLGQTPPPLISAEQCQCSCA